MSKLLLLAGLPLVTLVIVHFVRARSIDEAIVETILRERPTADDISVAVDPINNELQITFSDPVSVADAEDVRRELEVTAAGGATAILDIYAVVHPYRVEMRQTDPSPAAVTRARERAATRAYANQRAASQSFLSSPGRGRDAPRAFPGGDRDREAERAKIAADAAEIRARRDGRSPDTRWKTDVACGGWVTLADVSVTQYPKLRSESIKGHVQNPTKKVVRNVRVCSPHECSSAAGMLDSGQMGSFYVDAPIGTGSRGLDIRCDTPAG